MDERDMFERLLELREKAEAADERIGSEPDEEEPEEVFHQHHTGMLYSCRVPEILHRRMIPWYTSGFE